MFRRLLLVFIEPELRDKVIKIFLLLVAARLLAHIPIPVLTPADISPLIDSDAVLGLLNTVAGGAYGRLSFVMLGIGPYISASIVFQLLSVLVPSLAELQKEGGNAGQQQINQWTRYLTIPLAALQSWGILQFLSSGTLGTQITLPEVLTSPQVTWESFGYWSIVISSMTAGSIIMMWIGEIITEFKLGNGISLIIMTGIVSRLPIQVSKLFQSVQPSFADLFGKLSFESITSWDLWRGVFYSDAQWDPIRLTLSLLTLFTISLILVVFMNDAVRKVPIVYSRRGHSEGNSRTLSGLQANLPIKVNIAGVIPIIFSVSFIIFPTFIARFLATSNVESLRSTATSIESFLSTNPNQTAIKPDNLPNGVLGFYGTANTNDLQAAKTYDATEGTDLFGFELTTIPDTRNEFFNGTFLKFDTPSVHADFIPEYSLYFRGILAYPMIYFFLIIFFTYFYTANIIFKTEDVAERLQNWGAYIPGFRPGLETQQYLEYLSNRLNVAGALFLALIAITPLLIGNNLQFGDGTLNSIVGGTTLLILVAVTIETLKQIEAQATSIDYERFTKY